MLNDAKWGQLQTNCGIILIYSKLSPFLEGILFMHVEVAMENTSIKREAVPDKDYLM